MHTRYRSRKCVASRRVKSGQLHLVCRHDGGIVVVILDFSDAFVCVAAGLVVGQRAESSVSALRGVELVIEFVIEAIELRAER